MVKFESSTKTLKLHEAVRDSEGKVALYDPSKIDLSGLDEPTRQAVIALVKLTVNLANGHNVETKPKPDKNGKIGLSLTEKVNNLFSKAAIDPSTEGNDSKV